MNRLYFGDNLDVLQYADEARRSCRCRQTDLDRGIVMEEKFIVVWTIDGETMIMPYSTQDEALRRAEKLLREHGCNLEIALHLDRISRRPFIWFDKKRMRDWCLAGFPAVQI
jgi:hypothetical protein